MPTTPEESLGAQVRWLRLRRGWSQQRLAQVMTEHGHAWIQTTVAKTEAAQRPIRVNELGALAEVFEVDMAVLMSDPVDDSPETYDERRYWEARAAHTRSLEDVMRCREDVAAAEVRLREALDRSAVASAVAEAARIPVVRDMNVPPFGYWEDAANGEHRETS